MTLDKIAQKLKAGGTPRRVVPEYWSGSIPFVKIEDITSSNGFIHSTKETITEDGLKNSSAWLVPENSVLLSMYASIGEVAINRIPVATNQAIVAIIPDRSKVMEDFLLYNLISVGRDLIKFNVQSTQKNVNKGIVKDFLIAIPSIPEQRAISRVLRSVQQAREARLREIALERERKAALMEHLFTHGTKGEPTKQTEIGEMPESWEVEDLGRVFHHQLGKMLSGKARTGKSSRPYLRNANVQWGRIDISELYQMDFSDSEVQKFNLKYGDLLVCEGGDIGRTAIWRNELEGCCYQKALHRLRPKENLIIPEFFMYYFMMAFVIRNTYGVSGTKTTIAHLPAVKLKALPIPIPPLDEQERIENMLCACDSKIAALEHEAYLLDELFRAMLEELMSGRLPTAGLSIANRR